MLVSEGLFESCRAVVGNEVLCSILEGDGRCLVGLGDVGQREHDFRRTRLENMDYIFAMGCEVLGMVVSMTIEDIVVVLGSLGLLVTSAGIGKRFKDCVGEVASLT